MADPPVKNGSVSDFDGDEEHDDATMVTSAEDMERMKAQIAAQGVGVEHRATSKPPQKSEEPERTTLPPEQKVVVAPDVAAAPPSKTGLYAAIALCVVGFIVLAIALLRR